MNRTQLYSAQETFMKIHARSFDTRNIRNFLVRVFPVFVAEHKNYLLTFGRYFSSMWLIWCIIRPTDRQTDRVRVYNPGTGTF